MMRLKVPVGAISSVPVSIPPWRTDPRNRRSAARDFEELRRFALPSPRRSKFVRRGPSLLAEKAGEVGWIGERKIVGDLVDRLAGEYKLALGFGEHALPDQVAGGDAGCAPDVIVEAIDRHCELVGVEGELALLVEVLLDELAQRVDGGAGRLERDRPGAAAATGARKARHLDPDHRQQPPPCA